MRTIETGLKFVTYTISGEANYARMTGAELEIFRTIAANDEKIEITGVRKDKRRTVR